MSHERMQIAKKNTSQMDSRNSKETRFYFPYTARPQSLWSDFEMSCHERKFLMIISSYIPFTIQLFQMLPTIKFFVLLLILFLDFE